jgi:hypothetical protein
LAALNYFCPSGFGLISPLQASRRLQLVAAPNAKSAGGNCCHCDGFYEGSKLLRFFVHNEGGVWEEGEVTPTGPELPFENARRDKHDP